MTDRASAYGIIVLSEQYSLRAWLPVRRALKRAGYRPRRMSEFGLGVHRDLGKPRRGRMTRATRIYRGRDIWRDTRFAGWVIPWDAADVDLDLTATHLPASVQDGDDYEPTTSAVRAHRAALEALGARLDRRQAKHPMRVPLVMLDGNVGLERAPWRRRFREVASLKVEWDDGAPGTHDARANDLGRTIDLIATTVDPPHHARIRDLDTLPPDLARLLPAGADHMGIDAVLEVVSPVDGCVHRTGVAWLAGRYTVPGSRFARYVGAVARATKPARTKAAA